MLTKEIMLSFTQGNTKAFDQVFNCLFITLCGIADHYLNDKVRAEEIALNTLFIIWNKRSSFNDYTHLKGFSFLTVKNACLNHLSRKRFTTELHAGRDDNPNEIDNNNSEGIEEVFIEEENILSYIVEKEKKSVLYQAIDELPYECKRIVILYFLLQRSTKFICKTMNIHDSTARNQKARALKLLRDILAPKKHLLT